MNNLDDLREEHLGMAERDQAGRRALEEMRTVEEQNTERLK